MLAVVAAYFLKCSVLRWAGSAASLSYTSKRNTWFGRLGITRTLNSRQPGYLTALAAFSLIASTYFAISDGMAGIAFVAAELDRAVDEDGQVDVDLDQTLFRPDTNC